MKNCSLVRLLIVLRSAILRQALADSLAKFSTLEVVHGCDEIDACTVHQQIDEYAADIVIFHADSPLEQINVCVRALKDLRHNAQIIVSGLPDRDGDILAAIEAGAAGIATDATPLTELVENIHAIVQGRTLCSPRVASLLFARVADRRDDANPLAAKKARVTRREREIIGLIERGLTNKAIATRLHIEVQTVKNHVHNILEKLDLHRRTEVARYARAAGWIEPGTSTRPVITQRF